VTKSTKLRSLAPGIRSRKANISDISHAKAQSLKKVAKKTWKSLRLSLRLCVKLDSLLKSRYEETISPFQMRPRSDRLDEIVPERKVLNDLFVLFEFH
jgi:hypothetical protein